LRSPTAPRHLSEASPYEKNGEEGQSDSEKEEEGETRGKRTGRKEADRSLREERGRGGKMRTL
jgi:hypothetical protein